MKEQLAGGVMHNDNFKEKALTSAQLRHSIATGKAQDKVSNIDPAAAPLGTDDEAAGNPPSKDEIQQAAQNELQRSSVPSQPLQLTAIAMLLGAAAVLAFGTWIGVFYVGHL